MKKYIELEIQIYWLQEEDVIRTSLAGENGNSSTPGGGEDELPFVPFFNR